MPSRLAEHLVEASAGLTVVEHAPLERYTRFSVGGPARLLVDAGSETALITAVRLARESGEPWEVIGGGTNLVVSDEGFPGIILRYIGAGLEIDGVTLRAGAGAVLQHVVDASIARGLRGIETMTGIPGWLGGAIYGNAGAYGHSLDERIESVRFFDGAEVREISNSACRFRYRDSVFKRHKDWIVLSATLRLDPADPGELRSTAEGILKIRNEKYPPSMRCAGSIFKNLLWNDLPEAVRARVPDRVVREGKVPSAYFLEQAGAKGMTSGAIHVASYHANLLYNENGGTAREIRALIDELKRRVREQFSIELEEEVQYVGA